MNERIRELAEQARLYAEEQYPGSFVKYDPKWFEFYNEKFAKLIAALPRSTIGSKTAISTWEPMTISKQYNEHFLELTDETPYHLSLVFLTVVAH